jgi:hypothetical protein
MSQAHLPSEKVDRLVIARIVIYLSQKRPDILDTQALGHYFARVRKFGESPT